MHPFTRYTSIHSIAVLDSNYNHNCSSVLTSVSATCGGDPLCQVRGDRRSLRKGGTVVDALGSLSCSPLLAQYRHSPSCCDIGALRLTAFPLSKELPLAEPGATLPGWFPQGGHRTVGHFIPV